MDVREVRFPVYCEIRLLTTVSFGPTAKNCPARYVDLRKQNGIERQLGRGRKKNRLTRLMTLTLDPQKCAAEDSVAYLRKCFSKFRVSLLRRYDKTLSFIAVVELQKSGMAHLHVLIGIYIDQDWISQAWQRVGGGRSSISEWSTFIGLMPTCRNT